MSLIQIYNKGVELGYWKERHVSSSKATRIRTILNNYAYSGEPTPSGFIYPRLIEKETIKKAIILMKEAVYKPKYSKIIALAKGIITDEKTGYKLQYEGNQLKYIRTGDSRNKVVSVNLNIIDFLVWREASRVKWNLLTNKSNDTRQTVGKELEEIDDRIYNIQKVIDTEVGERFQKIYKAYINSRGRITDEDYNREVAAVEKEEKKYKTQIEALQQRKVELEAIYKDLQKEEDVDPSTVMGITDFKHQKEIVNEVLTLVTVNRTEEGQWIKIYNKLESKPEVYLNKGLTRKKEIYHLLNDTEAIDISDEFRPRYKRRYK